MSKLTFENIRGRFPKKRPTLSDYVEKIHSSHYEKNRSGATPITSIAQKLERWLHIKVAKDAINYQTGLDKSTLEIGAGNLNHLAYEPIIGQYDIVEPYRALFENKTDLKRINTIYGDVSEIPKDASYDRIITIATLEHILNLPEVVAKSALLLSPKGVFRAAIPNEGTLLWNLAWRCTTGIEFQMKYGIDYGLIMSYEHVNTAIEVSTVLNYFYSDIQIHCFGFNPKLALYIYYECSNPNIDRCIQFLKSI
jgi:hypothetical protein